MGKGRADAIRAVKVFGVWNILCKTLDRDARR